MVHTKNIVGNVRLGLFKIVLTTNIKTLTVHQISITVDMADNGLL